MSPPVLRLVGNDDERSGTSTVRAGRAPGTGGDAARMWPRRRERSDATPGALNGHRLRVIVVDDHELSRKGLIALLEQRGLCVVAEAALLADAVRQAVDLAPDVVVSELCLPGMTAIEATQRLGAIAPRVRVLVLTAVADEQRALAALRAGACGYMLKTASSDQIIDGIAAAARGESAISPLIAAGVVRRLRTPNGSHSQPGVPGLTPRELAVLELLAHGTDNRRIAQTLHLSQHTVKQHVRSILDKLEVENRIQAAVQAVRDGLV